MPIVGAEEPQSPQPASSKSPRGSTTNVKTGTNKLPIPQIRKVLGDLRTFDRTTINAWEDVEFVKAVKATGRKKLIITALWTDACLTFPSLDALQAGFEVYFVADAVGGTSVEAHESALPSHRAGRRDEDQFAATRVRVAARLGSQGHGRRVRESWERDSRPCRLWH